ncbi:hypothetical protein J6590_062035 [Homalodisca vitripennis]|nr:hypothetical protein J6590_062035 [Homalodisca vitripennis]
MVGIKINHNHKRSSQRIEVFKLFCVKLGRCWRKINTAYSMMNRDGDNYTYSLKVGLKSTFCSGEHISTAVTTWDSITAKSFVSRKGETTRGFPLILAGPKFGLQARVLHFSIDNGNLRGLGRGW